MSDMARAAQAWREGRIRDARRGYEDVLRTDAGNWGASFQLAWLDGAFGTLSPERVRALDRAGLSASARRMITALDAIARQALPLDGGEGAWDIEALRRAGAQETLSGWWEARGKRATKAGLYGTALACFEEAESREPNGAYWDPPAWAQSLPGRLDEHLELVANPFSRP